MPRYVKKPKGSGGRRRARKEKEATVAEAITSVPKDSEPVPSGVVPRDANDALLGYLGIFSTTIPVVPRHDRSIITIRSDASLSEALALISKERLTAIPVVDAVSGEVDSYLSVQDIVRWLAMNAGEDDLADGLDASLTRSMEAHAAANKEVANVAGLSGREPCCKLGPGDTLRDALRVVVGSGAHRVAIVDEGGALRNVITQTRILSIIGTARELVPFSTTPIGELSTLVKPDVVTVHEDQSLSAAFKAMHANGVSSVAVVKPPARDRVLAADRFIGVLSASDVINLGPQFANLDFVGKSAGEFLTPAQRHPVTVTVEDTLDDVIGKLLAKRLHRVFVVDARDEHRLIGVLSVGDVLRFIWSADGVDW